MTDYERFQISGVRVFFKHLHVHDQATLLADLKEEHRYYLTTYWEMLLNDACEEIDRLGMMKEPTMLRKIHKALWQIGHGTDTWHALDFAIELEALQSCAI